MANTREGLMVLFIFHTDLSQSVVSSPPHSLAFHVKGPTMDDWDADNYQPPEPTIPKTAAVNKWEGEDEDEDVKDNWEDDDEEEKKDSEKPPEPVKSAASKKPQKNLAQKIQMAEEKERLEKERAQQLRNLTPAELQAEKIRQRKLQEESELELVKATYGTSNSIDGINPSSKEEFDSLREAIVSKVNDLSKEEHYVEFVTELIEKIVVNLPAADLKKLSSNMTSLAIEKGKMDKAATSKKKGGKFKGAKLKMDNDLTSDLTNDYDDLDDFM
ncbi:eukaryotic translation initiation factor 3 subunit J [Thrips palmi]|uniref:Eukaryotic translation initiation factor 3 subunit J n=1 Tax=Thrips palmi TaxID=161013 RepID=A0A6P8ZR23_THRPL|nr:eukaryotic translation initiation factor 3 subunit J [Thrips palmi]